MFHTTRLRTAFKVIVSGTSQRCNFEIVHVLRPFCVTFTQQLAYKNLISFVTLICIFRTSGYFAIETMLSAYLVLVILPLFALFQVLLGRNGQNETFTKFQNFVKESLSSLIGVGKIQEATREVNAIVSVLNFYALQNGTAGREERQQVRRSIAPQ